ncbi:hypothetical protein FACS1894166_02160 [Bacilli bacterium]|nr:hypothetical protein FACS1894166_02160 [Bacilli bacterium]
MKFRSKILFPIVALVGLIPCITSCYHEPSYKVIGHAKITDFTITNFGDSSESSRTSLLIPVPVIQPSGDHHILPISDYEPDARLNTMIEPQLAPPDFDEYLNYLFEVKMSIQFNISSLDSSTAN